MSRYFSPLRVGGQLVDLSHLEPFTIIIQSEKVDKPLRIAITFSNHCFSASHGDIPHPPGDEVIWDGRKMRTFCPTRYRLSHGLPDVIRSLEERKVILAAHGASWIHTLTIENPDGPYHLFLTVKRSSNEKRAWQDIDVIVESAYPETRNAPTTTGHWRPFVLVCGEAWLSNPQKPKKKRRR
ncbi:heat-shock protein [uncultured Stenotrophomonas sp.]|uniref:heat-shock protein n=1 Tax=uncultured Stenotrophomonas sp. TaxID=165438 RepID=UPI0028EDB90F|nr:heat-shock protein [uncultured Stenotrophomonas sp.]